MKQFSMSQWILLGSILALATACTGQNQQSQDRKIHQQQDDDDEDRDGDMSEMKTSDESQDPALAEKEASQAAPSSEVKAALPVPAAPVVTPATQVSENHPSTIAPAPVEKVVAENTSSAAL